MAKNSDNIKERALNVTVKKKGNNLNRVGTANSVSSIISCKGCVNKLLSEKKPEAIPINISLVI